MNATAPKATDSLQITTPSDREIAMSRVFHAPRELVFDAYTRPELVQRWLGVFNGWTLPVCEIDLRVGGTFRYVWRRARVNPPADASCDPIVEMGMSGVFREIVPGHKLVSTETFDDPWYEGEALNTVDFVESDGWTTLTITSRYDSQATRDGVLRSGMETGLVASFDQLANLLAEAGD